MTPTYCLLPWKKPALGDNEYPSAVKWTVNNTKYEIYSTTLEDMDVDKVLQHCLDVKGKINKEVSSEAHLGPSYFKVFPRTLSIPLTTIWDTIVADMTEAHGGPLPRTADNFEAALRDFVASNTTTQDRHCK